MKDTRKYILNSGQGRLDTEGNEWFACDPYPTWFRWENDKLVRPNSNTRWAEKDLELD